MLSNIITIKQNDYELEHDLSKKTEEGFLKEIKAVSIALTSLNQMRMQNHHSIDQLKNSVKFLSQRMNELYQGKSDTHTESECSDLYQLSSSLDRLDKTLENIASESPKDEVSESSEHFVKIMQLIDSLSQSAINKSGGSILQFKRLTILKIKDTIDEIRKFFNQF